MVDQPLLLHVDADAFFASVALRSRPDLVHRPVAAVAHVFVASANYPARARGVRGGMLLQAALHQCPELVQIELPSAEIEEAGDALFDLFNEYARAVEPGSIEEAFLDVGANSVAEAVAAGQSLRRRVRHQLGITVSVGVGRTKLMAKLASRRAKPDGLRIIGPDEEANLRNSLTLDDVWGVGPATRARLTTLGVVRLGDLDRISTAELQRACGVTMANLLQRIRAGTDDAVMRPVAHRSTLSSEASTSGYARADHSPAEMASICLKRVCRRAERAGLVATGLTLQLRPESEGAMLTLKGRGIEVTADPASWEAIALDLLARASPPSLSGLRVTLTGLVARESAPQTLF
ncbi:DNA polymerase IV [Microbacteriaceae bacterium VKM Ac-2854]|nr:DNA polymerase IV [Microbacteriaceae bacterium VKM Ac-2854]